MCFFSAPKVPTPPQPAQFQAMKLPDGGSTNAVVDVTKTYATSIASQMYQVRTVNPSGMQTVHVH